MLMPKNDEYLSLEKENQFTNNQFKNEYFEFNDPLYKRPTKKKSKAKKVLVGVAAAGSIGAAVVGNVNYDMSAKFNQIDYSDFVFTVVVETKKVQKDNTLLLSYNNTFTNESEQYNVLDCDKDVDGYYHVIIQVQVDFDADFTKKYLVSFELLGNIGMDNIKSFEKQNITIDFGGFVQ